MEKKIPAPEHYLKNADTFTIANVGSEQDFIPKAQVLLLLREYGKYIRNVTLDWAAENAKPYYVADEAGIDPDSIIVWKGTILAGKTHPELEI